MAIVVNAKTYTADIPSGPNSQPYIGPANTLSIKDRIELYRTYPKATKEFSGMARSRIKSTRTFTLTGALTLTADGMIDTQIAIPVGAAGADVDSLVDDHGDLLITADGKNLAKNLDLSV
jgi:hypothetical protein